MRDLCVECGPVVRSASCCRTLAIAITPFDSYYYNRIGVYYPPLGQFSKLGCSTTKRGKPIPNESLRKALGDMFQTSPLLFQLRRHRACMENRPGLFVCGIYTVGYGRRITISCTSKVKTNRCLELVPGMNYLFLVLLFFLSKCAHCMHTRTLKEHCTETQSTVQRPPVPRPRRGFSLKQQCRSSSPNTHARVVAQEVLLGYRSSSNTQARLFATKVPLSKYRSSQQ